MAYITHSYVNDNGDFDTWDEYVPDEDPNAGKTVYEGDPNVGSQLPYTAVGLSDGSVIYQDPSTNKYYDVNGKEVTSSGADVAGSGGTGSSMPDINVSGAIKAMLSGNALAKAATAAAALKAMAGGNKVQTAGWQGSVPMDRELVRSQVNYNDANRRPGEAGRQYFTKANYVPSTSVDVAQNAANTEAAGIAAGYQPRRAETPPEQHPVMAMPWNKRAALPPAQTSGISSLPVVPQAENIPKFAAGGQPRYLQGKTDGMADEIPSSIDGHQKAALSHGEFVIPADVVSHLGNGNSDAGAQKLYQMMSKVRKARTGNPEQGKRIDPNKFMPGGQVGYASGGDVKGFDGTTGSTVSSGTTGTGSTGSTLGSTSSSNLSSWAGPYVSDYLSKGAAVANAPYQAYTGPLTAGPSDLQNQQFAGISSLAQTGYDPSQFASGNWNAGTASQYMNPYLSAALDPQIKEIQRQAQVQNLQNQAQATKQGAFGSSGSALMQTEGQRNALDKIQQALGTGYKAAYDTAQNAYNTDAQRSLDAQKAAEQSRQYSSDFGLKTLADLGTAGATQQGLAQQGINADIKQFEEQRDYPAKMVQYQKDLLQGLPITTTQTTSNQTDISNLTSQINGLYALYNSLNKLGQTPTTSDIRTKENIELIEIRPDGLGVYEFEYKPQFKDWPSAGHGRFRGLMAHEVEAVYPHAVTEISGYKAVIYSQVG